MLVSGYHLGIEDQGIYLPAIKKLLQPSLYPHDSQFFLPQATATLFPQLIAGSVRWTGSSLELTVFLWQVLAVFLTLVGCFRLSSKVFASPQARWAAVLAVAIMLTLPAASTALFLVDPYLHPRNLAAPALLFMLVDVIERRWLLALMWVVVAAALHVQMAFYGVLLAVVLLLPEQWLVLGKKNEPQMTVPLLLMLPLRSLFEPGTPAWREAARTREFHYLTQWPWYGWAGAILPLVALLWFSRIARRDQLTQLQKLSSRLALFGFAVLAASVLITLPSRWERLTPYQPMRAFHLLYIVFVLIAGGVLGEFVLRHSIWRWLAVFLPLSATMFCAQRLAFPGSSHLEWPDSAVQNPWLRAFAWSKANTPVVAYFALEPRYLEEPGEDTYGFRAFAERSMMADYRKDSGVALLFPAIAEDWQRELHARDGWHDFQLADFQRLHRDFGVDWVLLEPGHAAAGLDCRFQDQGVRVCHIP